MAFFYDKWTIVDIDLDNILMLRKSTNDILLDTISKDTNISKKESVVKDILEEYDVAIGFENELYIIYQNKEMHLVLTILKGEDRQDINLTLDPIPEVIDINIKIIEDKIHIIYIIKMEDEKKLYRIYHNYYDGKDWATYIVKEIIAKKVLNPIKLIQEEENLFLAYYNNQKEIEIKEFNGKMVEWSKKFKLVENNNEKLYLDMIRKDNIIYLTYCEFQNDNLVIMYERFRYVEGVYKKELEKIISNEGSLSNPTIIFYNNNLWITWVETDKVISRISEDGGEKWSPYMYMWNQINDIDFVRYKYLSKDIKKDIALDYSFGSVYPEIKFIGFGSVENTTKIPIKKKNSMNLTII
jgi:hypothetical protein